MPLQRCQLQPMPGLLGLEGPRLAIKAAQLKLRPAIASTRRLAQQLYTDAPVAGITTLAAEHLAQPTLRLNHTLARRLLEQPTGDAFHAGSFGQPRAVEQPGGKTNGNLGTNGERMEFAAG